MINAGLCDTVRSVTCKADELNEPAGLQMKNYMKRDGKRGRDESDRCGWATCGFEGVRAASSEPMEAPKTAAIPLSIPGLGQEKWRGRRREAGRKRGRFPRVYIKNPP